MLLPNPHPTLSLHDAEQATDTKFLQYVVGSTHRTPLIAQRNGSLGEDRARPTLIRGLKYRSK